MRRVKGTAPVHMNASDFAVWATNLAATVPLMRASMAATEWNTIVVIDAEPEDME